MPRRRPAISPIRRRHDPFLKRLYRAGTRDALTLFFPDLAARIDWRHWHWIDKEIVIRARRPRSVVADLVGETRDLEGRYLKVLVHPELQMRPDEEMDWRIFEYSTGLLLREGDRRTRVLSVVFYHCPGTGGIQERYFLLEFYDKVPHAITYWSVGLGELDAEGYVERKNPMGWALASWMRQQREQRVELRLRLIEKIVRLVRVETYRELLLDTIQTYYRLSGIERRAEEHLLQSGDYEEATEMAQTVFDRMKARERRETLQEAVKQAIVTRFPDAPTSLTGQVERVRAQRELEELHRRAILASSLEEIERLLSS